MSDPFAPPGVPWTPISPRLTSARRVALLLTQVPLLAVVVVVGLVLRLPTWLVVLVAGLTVVYTAVSWVVIGIQTRRWAYAEREDDLYIRSGALFRRLVAVPYGRMQFVDVASGPLDRHFGVATLRLHTAAPGTSAVVPGVPADEAARLRDRLTELGEATGSGL